MRTETREQRYQNKSATAVRHRFAVAACNFTEDANVGYLARSLACFGGESVHVIGRIPDNKTLMKYSGTVNRFLPFFNYSTPGEFIDYCRENNWTIVSAELTEGAVDFHTVKFDKNKKYMFVVGNESDGVPVDIVATSDIVTYIPMPGFGFCLNTSQTGNIIFYEYARQVSLDP